MVCRYDVQEQLANADYMVSFSAQLAAWELKIKVFYVAAVLAGPNIDFYLSSLTFKHFRMSLHTQAETKA